MAVGGTARGEGARVNFEEHAAKPLLEAAGLAIPSGQVVESPEAAAAAARLLGPVMVKAQVPAGKRGKAGGVRPAADPEAAAEAARAILGTEVGGFPVERVLIEEQLAIASELYAAVLNDPVSRGPLLVVSARGGMDIEEVAAEDTDAVLEQPVDVARGLERDGALAISRRLELDEEAAGRVADALVSLYQAYDEHDAELLEVNPLALLDDGRVAALDCKLVLDDSALKRRAELAERGAAEPRTALEERAREEGLTYIELDGDVGVLANGAGVTMTTMDVVVGAGGRPANFMEIGGDAYTRGRQATEIVLANPNVRSLVVNFCGAFARTDVMTKGVIEALEAHEGAMPVFFSIKGTGADAAVRLLVARLGMTPQPGMDEAVRAAVAAAAELAEAEGSS